MCFHFNCILIYTPPPVRLRDFLHCVSFRQGHTVIKLNPSPQSFTENQSTYKALSHSCQHSSMTDPLDRRLCQQTSERFDLKGKGDGFSNIKESQSVYQHLTISDTKTNYLIMRIKELIKSRLIAKFSRSACL